MIKSPHEKSQLNNLPYNGEVMAAISAKGGAVRDSEEVEVLACRKALEFAIDAGFMEVILEGANARVLKTVAQAQPDLA